MKGRVPSVPIWVRWVLRLMMSPDDVRAALSELEELYRARVSEARVPEGDAREADRWYCRQVRQYPFQLLAQRARRRQRGGVGLRFRYAVEGRAARRCLQRRHTT